MPTLHASAPGRVCLFGEHQDYLGLPVLAAAIDLRLRIAATPSHVPGFRLEMPDTGERMVVDPAVEQTYAHHRDYLRSAVNVLRREGLRWTTGYDGVVRGSIPINAGVSSSSALVTMWLRFLLGATDREVDFSPDELARWAFQAEVAEFGEPGGMMDHYCAAVGGVLFIDTRPPFEATSMPAPLPGLVLGNSREPKATLEILRDRREGVAAGIALLRGMAPGFELNATPLQEVDELIGRLPAVPMRRLRANLVNRDLTVAGRDALNSGDIERVGELLTEHHAQLRDGLELSTPRIERMLHAALSAGALGGKINGSGGGGCMFVLAPGREQEAAEAIRSEDADAWIVRVDSGAEFRSEE